MPPLDHDGPHLMIPGPCQLHPEDLEILGGQVEPHYGPDWSRRYEAVLAGLRRLLGAPHAYLIPGSGTCSLDAALFNLFEPRQRVVVPDTGYFGRRLAAMARAHQLEVRLVPVAPGEPVDLGRVAEALTGADGLVTVHAETATGVRHPVADLAAQARAAGAYTLVDGVASVGGELLDVESMGIDAVVTASQKGLGGPPGLGVVALSRRGRERVYTRSCPPQSWYLDLRQWDQARDESPSWEPHPVTMPTNLVAALASSVERILATGLHAWVAERAELARYCRDGFRRLGLRPIAAEEHAANLVAVIRTERDDHIRSFLASYAGITVAKGLEPFDEGVLRVGLVGRTAEARMVEHLLSAVKAALRDSG